MSSEQVFIKKQISLRTTNYNVHDDETKNGESWLGKGRAMHRGARRRDVRMHAHRLHLELELRTPLPHPPLHRHRRAAQLGLCHVPHALSAAMRHLMRSRAPLRVADGRGVTPRSPPAAATARRSLRLLVRGLYADAAPAAPSPSPPPSPQPAPALAPPPPRMYIHVHAPSAAPPGALPASASPSISNRTAPAPPPGGP